MSEDPKNTAADTVDAAELLEEILSTRGDDLNEAHVHGSVLQQSVMFAENYMKPQAVTGISPIDGADVPVVIDRTGVRVIPPSEFEPWAFAPRFRKGTACLTDLSSFIAHVNRYKDGDSAIFANDDRTHPSFTGVLNYHEAGAEGEPRFGDHRSHFAFPLSDEWKAWKGVNDTPMTMTNFARFLEDHIIDVLPTHLVDVSDDDGTKIFVDNLGGVSSIADPARLMSLVSNLQINENSVVSQAQRLSSGEVSIEFNVDHQATQNGQSVTVPTMFAIGIPVFKNGESYRIMARLRYRKEGSKLVFWFELWRADRVFDKAFDESVARVRDETQLPVFMGTDEG